MKLKSEFVVHQTMTETILVPVGGNAFSGIMKGNATLGEILSLVKEDISEQELIHTMQETFDAPEEVIARDVRKALTDLRAIGALEE